MLEGFGNYQGREQSAVKHEVLKQYLESFAHIVGSKWNSITYIDGFSGPWNVQTSDLSDTSFSIALNQLRRARDTHSSLGKTLGIRCVFVEKDAKAYLKLKEFAESVKDAEIHTIHGEFENSILEIIDFVHEATDTFPFTLIDPTGSSGFKMNVIAPLLALEPGEVIINFMLEFIRRYIEQEGLREGLTSLFGTDNYDEKLANLAGIDRDDEITDKYCQCLSRSCGYPYVLRASILHPDKDRLHFQLIYGTRHPVGVKAFKGAEKNAMALQERSRAHIEVGKNKKQKSFLDPDEMPESRFYSHLRLRYLEQAKQAARALVQGNVEVTFDELWIRTLAYPMVWESDLQEWLKDWRQKEHISWFGLKPRERTLKINSGHFVKRVSDR